MRRLILYSVAEVSSLVLIAVHPELPPLKLELVFFFDAQLTEYISCLFKVFNLCTVRISTVYRYTHRTWAEREIIVFCSRKRTSWTIAHGFIIMITNGAHWSLNGGIQLSKSFQFFRDDLFIKKIEI